MAHQKLFLFRQIGLLSLAMTGLAVACAAQSNAASAAPPSPAAPRIRELASRTFAVRQTVVLQDIPQGAKKVGFWISIPDDTCEQRVLDLSVASAPGSWRMVREKDHGNYFLYTEVDNPRSNALTAVVDFTVRRQAVFFDLDPAAALPLSESQKRLFADALRLDAPHMEVTDAIREISKETCGGEANPVLQVRQLLEYVAQHADHYSKDPTKPTCGVGDAGNCLANGGGCCTDLHSLFIALARARGIPARLQMGYRLQPKNEGKEADPGYRCWPEYFIAGYGWVPADVVEADAAEGDTRVRWLSGLNERRVHLNAGRNFELSPKQSAGPVNTMIIGYAEIDGVPARVLPEGDKPPQLTRTVKYSELPGGGPVLYEQASAR